MLVNFAENRKDLYIGIGFLVAALALTTFAVAAQAREGEDDDSASVNSTQGLKLRGDGTVDDTQPAGVAQGLERRGDGTLDDTADDSEDEDSDDNSGRENGQANATERRSSVANFVQSLLRVAEREPGGIGEQVRVIAQEQNESNETATEAVTEVQTRGKIRTLLFGSDYKNLGVLRKEVVQTRNRLQQLDRLIESMTSDEDKTEVQVQIQALSEQQTILENFVEEQESKMSLFGWLVKMFQ